MPRSKVRAVPRAPKRGVIAAVDPKVALMIGSPRDLDEPRRDLAEHPRSRGPVRREAQEFAIVSATFVD